MSDVLVIYLMALKLLLTMWAAHFGIEFCVPRHRSGPQHTIPVRWCTPYFYSLVGHACLQGLAVGYIMSSALYGGVEVVLHFSIAYFEDKGKLNVNDAQALHMSTKMVYIFIAVFYVITSMGLY